jgi:hypothetical protein
MGVKLGILHLRKRRRLGAFNTMVLTKIFGSTMEEVTVGWRKFHNGEVLSDILKKKTLLEGSNQRGIEGRTSDMV